MVTGSQGPVLELPEHWVRCCQLLAGDDRTKVSRTRGYHLHTTIQHALGKVVTTYQLLYRSVKLHKYLNHPYCISAA